MSVRMVPGVARIELDGDGVIVHQPEADVDVAGVAEMIRHQVELADGKPRPILVDIRKVRRIDRAGRELAASDEVAAVTSRLALLVGGKLTAMIGSFFLRVSQPRYPSKMFTDPAAARAWLLGRDDG